MAALKHQARRRSATPLKRRRRRWPIVLALLAVAAGAAVVLMPRKTEVQVSAVLAAYPSQQYADLTASGYVVAQRRAAVASKGTGRLIELRVREGSVVNPRFPAPVNTCRVTNHGSSTFTSSPKGTSRLSR